MGIVRPNGRNSEHQFVPNYDELLLVENLGAKTAISSGVIIK